MNADKKDDPFQYMILKKEMILSAISQTSTLQKAWNILLENIPEIEDKIRFNTFKVYARILVKFSEAIDKKESEIEKVRQDLEFLKKLSQNHEESESVPKRFRGWGVQMNNGYYRLFKKINGKVRWIYIGKQWNQSAAGEKISRFRLDNFV